MYKNWNGCNHLLLIVISVIVLPISIQLCTGNPVPPSLDYPSDTHSNAKVIKAESTTNTTKRINSTKYSHLYNEQIITEEIEPAAEMFSMEQGDDPNVYKESSSAQGISALADAEDFEELYEDYEEEDNPQDEYFEMVSNLRNVTSKSK